VIRAGEQFLIKLTELAERSCRPRNTTRGFVLALFVMFILVGPSSYRSWNIDQGSILDLNQEMILSSQELTLLRDLIRELTFFETKVTATMYKPHRVYTDDSPNILADGTKINIYKVNEYRYVALSRDLLHRWGGPFNYGDFIVVEGAGDHSGVWRVKDTMHERWVNRLDFLMPLGTKPFKYEGVVIRKQRPTLFAEKVS